MAGRFSRGRKNAFQFQQTPLNEMMAVPAMLQDQYNNTQQALLQEKTAIGNTLVRGEDAPEKQKIMDALATSFDDISSKNGGDLVAAASELYGAIGNQRATGKLTQMGQIYLESEENRKMEAKMRATNTPFAQKGNAAGQALFNEQTGEMRDLSYDVKGYEKNYRPFKEEFYNNKKASFTGTNIKQLQASYAAAGGDPNNMQAYQLFIEREAVKYTQGQQDEIANDYLSSNYGQSEVDMFMSVNGIEDREVAIQMVKDSFNSVTNEYSYEKVDNQLINNIPSIVKSRGNTPVVTSPTVDRSPSKIVTSEFPTVAALKGALSKGTPAQKKQAKTQLDDFNKKQMEKDENYGAALKDEPKFESYDKKTRGLISNEIGKESFREMSKRGNAGYLARDAWASIVRDSPKSAKNVFGDPMMNTKEKALAKKKLEKVNAGIDEYDAWYDKHQESLELAEDDYLEFDGKIEGHNTYKIVDATDAAQADRLIKDLTVDNSTVSELNSVEVKDAINKLDKGINSIDFVPVSFMGMTDDGSLKIRAKVDGKEMNVVLDPKNINMGGTHYKLAELTGIQNSENRWFLDQSYALRYPDRTDVSEDIDHPDVISASINIGNGVKVNGKYLNIGQMVDVAESDPSLLQTVVAEIRKYDSNAKVEEVDGVLMLQYDENKVDSKIFIPQSAYQGGTALEAYVKTL